MTIRRILHATDFSPASRPALALARTLATTFKAELVLFHAWEAVTPLVAEGYGAAAVLDEVWAATSERARRDMKRLADRTKTKGLRLTTVVVQGPAAPSIVRAAKRRRAGLIVIGTHGRTGVKRMLLGSVAERVVRTASTPVLSVNARR